MTEIINYDPTLSFVEGQNYALFSGITGVTSIGGTINRNGTSDPTIAGFQLVSVPEPGALALVTGLVFGLIFWRKR